MKTGIFRSFLIVLSLSLAHLTLQNRQAIALIFEVPPPARMEGEKSVGPYRMYLPITFRPDPNLKLSNNSEIVYEFHLSSDGEWAVYQSECDVFAIPIQGQTSPTKISNSGECIVVGEGFQISPDSSTVVYIAFPPGGGDWQLYRANIDGNGISKQLSVGALPTHYVREFIISPDSQWVVYSLNQGSGLENENDLYSVRLDGSDTPILLHPAMVPPGGIFWGNAFVISPDCSRVIYMADQEIDEKFELYSVPMDGELAPVKLSSPTMQPHGDIRYSSYTFSPDSQRVVYTADQETDETTELFSVPSDGSHASIKLNTPLEPGRNAGFMNISPDGYWVIYTADQNSANNFEMFRVPTDGSAAPTQLNAPKNVGLGKFSPNDSYYVFQKDWQLFSISLDPNVNAQPILLSGNTITETNHFEISPDSQWVVFDLPNQRELYRVPIDGSSAPQFLATPSQPENFILDFSVSANSEWVVYLEDRSDSDYGEIFAVPINGSQLPIKLNGSMIPNGGISHTPYTFEINAQSLWVVYVADQEKDGLFELYASLLGYLPGEN